MELLILTRMPEIYSSVRLAEEAKQAGHSPRLMSPEDLDIEKQTPHFIIPRFGTFRFENSLSRLHWFEKKRIPVLNTTLAYQQARNKWMTHLHLQDLDLPTLPTRAVHKQDLVGEALTFPFVLKPLEGAKGEGVRLIQNNAELMSLSASEEFLWQPYVKEAKNKDIRLFVVDDKVVASMQRTAPHGDFRSNISLGGAAETITPTNYEIEIAIKATKVLKLDYAGVDIIRSNQGPMILELNPCPGLEGIEKCTGVNVAKVIIQYIEKKQLK